MGKSSKGLKIHKGRKHGEMISCDVCENIFESKRDYFLIPSIQSLKLLDLINKFVRNATMLAKQLSQWKYI